MALACIQVGHHNVSECAAYVYGESVVCQMGTPPNLEMPVMLEIARQSTLYLMVTYQ